MRTDDGLKTERGKDLLQTVKTGPVFGVNDGSGIVHVNPSEGMDVELDQSFEQTQNVSYGNVVFGSFHTDVSASYGDRRTTGIRAVEKILPPAGKLFVLGQLESGQIGKPKGLLGSLRASRKGREALIGSTRKKRMAGLIAAAVMIVPGLGLSIFASPPTPGELSASDVCNIVDGHKEGEMCTGKIRDDDGQKVPLKVTQAGTFQLHAAAPSGKKIPLIAVLSVTDASGKAIVEHESESADVALAPGDYTITVKNLFPGEAQTFRGGFSFELTVKRSATTAPVASAATAVGSATTTSAELTDEKAETGQPSAAVKAPAPKAAKPTKPTKAQKK